MAFSLKRGLNQAMILMGNLQTEQLNEIEGCF